MTRETDVDGTWTAVQRGSAIDLNDFFSPVPVHTDRWREWDERVYDTAGRLLADLAALEDYWADSSTGVLAMREEPPGAMFERVVRKVSAAVLDGYRPDFAAWGFRGGSEAPRLFDVLVVTPTDPRGWEHARNELRRLRRAEDLFTYEVRHVAGLHDAVIATVFDTALHAMVLEERFPIYSRRDVARMREFLDGHVANDAAGFAPGVLATTVVGAVKEIRPEGEVYAIGDVLLTTSGPGIVAVIR